MINIGQMAIGEVFKLKGEDAQDVKYVRTLQTKPRKAFDRTGNAVEAQPYAQMRYAGISFTVNTKEDIDILSDKKQREEVCSITLEVTEFDQPVLDGEGNPVFREGTEEPIMEHRRGLAFVSLQTWASKQKLALREVTEEGAIHAEKVKFGLIAQNNVSDVAAELIKQLEAKNAKVAHTHGAAAPVM